MADIKGKRPEPVSDAKRNRFDTNSFSIYDAKTPELKYKHTQMTQSTAYTEAINKNRADPE